MSNVLANSEGLQADNKRENKNKKKKMYVKEGVTVEDLRVGWTQCCYFIKKKKRLCNMQRASRSVYCPVHRSDVAVAASSDSVTDEVNIYYPDSAPPLVTLAAPSTQIEKSFVRIPCPIEPTHSVYKHKLTEHLKKCNTKTRFEHLEQFPYYCKDCNTGHNHGPSPPSATEIDADAVADEDVLNAVDPDELLRKVDRLYTTIEQDIRALVTAALKAITLPEEGMVSDLSGNKSSFSKVRHAHQDILLIKNMMQARLLTVTPRDAVSPEKYAAEKVKDTTTFLELGAGKGLLGLAVASAQRGSREEEEGRSQLVMVERAGSKKTGDRALDGMGFARYARIRMDLRDCVLPNLPGVMRGGTKTAGEEHTPLLNAADNVVLVAKHLCGVATDISLRSAATFASADPAAGADAASVLSSQLKGVAIATCCHHACTYKDYVGDAFLNFQDGTISEQEFDLLKQWSGWAHSFNSKATSVPNDSELTSATDQPLLKKTKLSPPTSAPLVTDHTGAEGGGDEEDEDPDNSHSVGVVEEAAAGRSSLRPSGFTSGDMAATGREVKRILDQGRVLYLRSLGLDAYQVQYCPSALSPECFMIIAKQREQGGDGVCKN